ncbi:MAG: hypothetical protein FWH05_04110 [Oscillospiraceae bacterium]|nr:hypothetical protein [Oscillospiraceae bacterium]
MEITINSNAKLEIESSGDYKKDVKKACRFAYGVWSEQLKLANLITTLQNRMAREGLYKPFEDFEEKQEEFVLKLPGQLEAEREAARDKKINKNFQRFIEASKKIKEAEAAGEDLPESVFKKWTPEDERAEREAEWESKQLEKLTAIMSEEIMRIDGESRAKDSDSKFEHIFKHLEKGITEEKMEKYRKLYENSKATHSKQTHFIDAKFEVKADNQTNESGAPTNPTPPVSRPQIPKITDILKETIRPSNEPLLEENLSKLEAMREKHKPPKKDVNLLQDLVSSRVEPVIKLVDNVVDMFKANEERKKYSPIIVTVDGTEHEIDRDVLRNTNFGDGYPVLKNPDFVEFLFRLGMANDERALVAKEFARENGGIDLDGFGLVSILIWESTAGAGTIDTTGEITNNLFGQHISNHNLRTLSNGVTVNSGMYDEYTEIAYNRAVEALKEMKKSDEEIYTLMTTSYDGGGKGSPDWSSAYLQAAIVYETTFTAQKYGENMSVNYECLPEAIVEAEHWRKILLK